MSVWTDFENWRDSLYCGGEPEHERIEAEVGAKYELYDYINSRVESVVICTEENKAMIERSLNDHENDMWCYCKVA